MLYAAFRFASLGLLIPALLFHIALSGTAEAQLSGKIAEHPIAVGYARNMTQKRIFEYVIALTERLEIAATMRSLMSEDDIREQFDDTHPQVDEPVSGIAWYMVTGLKAVAYGLLPVRKTRRRSFAGPSIAVIQEAWHIAHHY